MVSIDFGALCEPIQVQLKKQGFELSPKDAEWIQSLSNAIITLKINGLIPDSAAHKAQEKLMKKIVIILKG